MATAEMTATSTITWFEIPAADFGRAVRFYETIFASPLRHEAAWPNMAIFHCERPGVSGAVVGGEGRRPSSDGVVIYLNCDGRIDAVLGRVEKAGGGIVEAKNHIPSVGWVAQIRDSEGNRIGLHAAA
ncbi:MAG TPA: VOC family protein [Acidobacteriaceae bacterium]|nr:VOC family protein [Acidobacteriaceae bacterium]